jgi:uncharacterized protein (TIGR00251 family)
MMISRSELATVFHETAQGATFSVTVLPRSSRCELTGIHDGALRVKLTKPPVDGEANAECCRFMARLLDIAKSRVTLLRGGASRHKMLLAEGLSAAKAMEHIAAVFPISD